ncbi:Holliday junction resolvase RuvX [Altererythrobacter sp. SALINAS58]|uniref:Holliday junction resolvase RuvX n=1 Tax=Alteripontixanthobacter muriae TaxID=2705546 RepID=UPI001576A6B4|nr:Holliday junction resolvase RuvX [Alteripontixanthobacter muriae]NTZ42516.1 Holliday junction resolvase RuvX [Alteripontixanthobacter muriae]
MDQPAPVTTSKGTFRDLLPDGGVLLALDIGTKTIGTAFCDAGWRFATAGKTVPRGKFSRDRAVLAELAKSRSVAGLVIGLPLNMDGSEGPRAQASRAYARNLAPLEVPILLWDERWSTSSAERDLIGQDFSRRKRAERIDSHAAAVILQAAIDALAGGIF